MRVSRLGGCLMAVLAVSVEAAGRDVPIVQAVKEGDAQTLRRLLQRQADVNAPEDDGTTALHWAAERDDLEAVRLLIRNGANANSRNRYGATPLLAASISGNAAIVEALLQAGADPGTASTDGETVLMVASRTGNPAAVKALLARGAGVNDKERLRGQTALMWAAAENHSAVIETLIGSGADIHARSTGGFTALLFAVRAGQMQAVRSLLAAGAKVNDMLAPDAVPATAGALSRSARPDAEAAGQARPTAPRILGAGTSALVMAVVNAHYEIAALLLEKGADPNADAQGWTALHQIAWTRRPPNVKGLPPPVPTGNLDSLSLAKMLIARGADPNARQKREPNDGHRLMMMSRVGATPFFNAAKGTDLELMRVLVANGADPLLKTEEGSTPLMAAAGVGIWKVGENAGTNEEALETVKYAVELGNDVNAVNAIGMTALHGAALRGAHAIVQLLVDNGAKVDVRNKIGWTPLTIAEGVLYPNTFSRSSETATVLRQLGARDVGQRRPEDYPPSEVFVEASKVTQKP